MKKRPRKTISKAMQFILLFGIVSLFSDMTHEAASSIRGVYFSLLGASAAAIGFISGLGELIGYSMRFVFGRIADKTKHYWFLTLAGYILDIVCVPLLALVHEDGWILACALLILQRIGKAIKKPAKNTIMSFAASCEGAGKSFGLQELLDQIGAFLGPVFLYLVLLGRTEGTAFDIYASAFAFLAIPGAITLILLFITKRKFPDPEKFEPEPSVAVPFRIGKKFVLYIAGISLFAFGFIDYSLVVLHVSKTFTDIGGTLAASAVLDSGSIPLLYAFAMLIDAVAAMVFGYMYDKHGLRALILSTLLSAPFPILIFMSRSVPVLLIGIAMWGVGMGAQESVFKAVVSRLVPKQSRATGYGIFEFSFGVFWFLGSWLLGSLFSVNITLMVIISVLAQLASIPLYILASKQH